MIGVEAPIPPASLPVSASAPAKVIVFGEHAVVHGAPEVLFALDLRTQLILRAGPVPLLNGEEATLRAHPYLPRALARYGGPPLEITAISRVPHAAGLGSSAALVSAMMAALGALGGGVDRPTLAQRAFDVEREAQGVGSPGDTSAAVAGGFLTLNAERGRPLWEVRHEDRSWVARRAPDPRWAWVVADSGIARATGPAVSRVTERLAQPDGPELLRKFRDVAIDGLAALEREDREAVGDRMRENHALLREVGVSHPRLESLLDAVREVCVGEKLTGAGQGGSVLALPRPGREIEVARRFRRAGGNPFVVVPADAGARLL